MPSENRECYSAEELSLAGTWPIPEIRMIGRDRFSVAAMAALESHSHPGAYEICLLVDGSVDWWVEDEQYTLHRGDVYVTHPDEKHGGLYSVMQPCELYWIQVDATELPPSLQTALLSIPNRVFPGSASIAGLFESILREHREPGQVCSSAFTRALLHSLLVTVLRDAICRSRTLGSVSSVIERARQLLESDLALPCSVEWVAEQVGVSPPRLVDRFLQEMGETPGEWRTRLRLEAAKQMLKAEPTTTITDIAFRYGFASSQHFATVFKRYMGLSPREWRQRIDLTITGAPGRETNRFRAPT